MKKTIALPIVLLLIILIGYSCSLIKRPAEPDALVPLNDFKITAQYKINEGEISRFNDSAVHYALKWYGPSASQHIGGALDSVRNLNHSVFIHLEVYLNDANDEWQSPADDIVAGQYDEKIAELAKRLAGFQQPVLLSYNDDVEVPVKDKPWKLQSSEKYIESFRRLSRIFRQHNKTTKIVWAPSGYPGTDEYWPGNEAADFFAVKLSSTNEVKDDSYPDYPSVQEMIRRKILRLRFSDKPILLQADATIQNQVTDTLLSGLNNLIKKDPEIYHIKLEGRTESAGGQKGSNVPAYIGLFDLDSVLVHQKDFNIEHIFIDFKGINDGKFEREFSAVMNRGHDAIVTFESWKEIHQEKDSNLIKNILAGKYDRYIEKVYEVIGAAPRTVFLRWGHEMEIPVNRYPWQLQDPVEYIKAYRYVVGFRNSRPANVKLIWGPAGDRGSVEWYPGDAYVDDVSIAIYGLPDKDIEDHNKQVSFESIFNVKNHRMRLINKPIFITEFGVKGPQDYKQKWLADAAATINKHHNIKGISYFNFIDVPQAWGNVETPDWSITTETFQAFMKALKNSKN